MERFQQPDNAIYAYVGNDPLNFGDPSGLAAEAARQNVGRAAVATGNFLARNETAVAVTIAATGVAFDVATFPSGEGALVAAAAPVIANRLAKGLQSTGRHLSNSRTAFTEKGVTIPGGRKIAETLAGRNKVKNARGEVFKRVDFLPSRPHRGLTPHTHPNYRNQLPDGSVRSGAASEGIEVTRKDIIAASRTNSQRIGPR